MATSPGEEGEVTASPMEVWTYSTDWLCGEARPLLDSSTLWDTQDPDVSVCMQVNEEQKLEEGLEGWNQSWWRIRSNLQTVFTLEISAALAALCLTVAVRPIARIQVTHFCFQSPQCFPQASPQQGSSHPPHSPKCGQECLGRGADPPSSGRHGLLCHPGPTSAPIPAPASTSLYRSPPPAWIPGSPWCVVPPGSWCLGWCRGRGGEAAGTRHCSGASGAST